MYEIQRCPQVSSTGTQLAPPCGRPVLPRRRSIHRSPLGLCWSDLVSMGLVAMTLTVTGALLAAL